MQSPSGEKKQYLGLVNLSGIHEFISESRKITDLKYGSGIARSTVEQIVMALKQSSHDAEEMMKELLQKIRSSVQDIRFIIPPEEAIADRREGYSYPNQLLFSFNGIPDQLEDRLNQVVRRFFRHLAESSFHHLLQHNLEVDSDLKSTWLRQWAEGLPLFFTAVDWDDDFVSSHKAVQKKLIAHKMYRHFDQWQGAEVYKCIQCGRRECFGPQEGVSANIEFWRDRCRALINRNIVKENERLCAVCLGKRVTALADGKQAVPSTTVLAARPFLEHLSSQFWEAEVQKKWSDFQEMASDASKHLPKGFRDTFRGIEHTSDLQEKLSQNAEWFYESFYDTSNFPEDVQKIKEFEGKLDCSKKKLNVLLKTVKAKPSKYLAIIEYDADEMGKKRGELNLAQLKGFSKKVSEIAEIHMQDLFSEWKGFLIYSGGEDVLGFSSMGNAIHLVKQINEHFTDKMKFSMGESTVCFTGSGSITFFPHDFPLQVALQVSNENLKRAKEEFDRNSVVLGVILPDTSQYVTGSKWQIPLDVQNVDYLDWLEVTLAFYRKSGRKINGSIVRLSRAFLYELMMVIEAFDDKQNNKLFWETDVNAFKGESWRLLKRHLFEKDVLKDIQVKNELLDWITCLSEAVLPQRHTKPLYQGMSSQMGLLKFIDFFHHRVEDAS